MGTTVTIFAIGAQHEAGLVAALDPVAPPREAGLRALWQRLRTPSGNAVSSRFVDALLAESVWVEADGAIDADATISVELDKSWDIIDRALLELVSAGKLDAEAGKLLFKGRPLPHGDFSCFTVSREELPAVARALRRVTLADFLSVREAACKGAYIGDAIADEAEFEDYVWDCFDDARWLVLCAARASRPIVVVMM